MNVNGEPAKTATMTIQSTHWATLEPVVRDLHELLGRWRLKFTPGGKSGHRVVGVLDYRFTDISHRWAIDKTTGHVMRIRFQTFPQGLVKPVSDWLSSHGYKITLVDNRTDSERWQRDPSAYACLPPRQQGFTDAFDEHRCLRVVARNVRTVADLTQVVVSVYDKARIAIGVSSKESLRRIRPHLRKVIKEPLGLYTSGRRQPARVSVGLISQLPRKEVGFYDLLVLPFAERTVGDNALQVALSAQYRRILAFTFVRDIRDHNIAGRMHLVAGAVWPPDDPQPPVTAVVLDAHGTRPRQMENAFEEKRDLYWLNARRNRRIAEVARRLAAGKKKPILALVGNPELTNTIVSAARFGVAILVETPVHARELAKLLPGWTVYTGTDRVLEDPPDGAGVIITEMVTADANPTAGVLVRATGTRWPLSLPGWPLGEGGQESAVLIDFADEYHPQAARYAKARAMSYAEAGMELWSPADSNRKETTETTGVP
jgi:hypothetical protein